MERREKTTESDPATSFLPDFCQAQSVFLVILAAEIMALIFTLVAVSPAESIWLNLGFYSLSIQFVALFSIAALCMLKLPLARLSNFLAGLLAEGIILVISIIFSTLAFYYFTGSWNWMANASGRFFVSNNALIAAMIGAVTLRYFYIQAQYKRQLALRSEARLQALQARIRPHFLFNSMNVIASLTRKDPQQAEAAIEDLADLFRVTLENTEDRVPLADELETGKRYVGLEQLRLGDRLTMQWEIDELALDFLLPPLTLQPLLENAIYHGIQNLAEGGLVKVSAQCEDEKLLINVYNPVSKRLSYSKQGHGIALKNIAERLETLYGKNAEFIRTKTEEQFHVKLVIPAKLKNSP